jgi:hypothetical protein
VLDFLAPAASVGLKTEIESAKSGYLVDVRRLSLMGG